MSGNVSISNLLMICIDQNRQDVPVGAPLDLSTWRVARVTEV